MSRPPRRYLFQGNVQGVGFRATTRRLARAHPVAGYVRNLPDGRVEVVVEGEAGPVAAFLGAIRREFEGDVDRVDEEPARDEEPGLDGFEIRY